MEKVIQYFYYKHKYANAVHEIPEFVIEPSVALELLMAAVRPTMSISLSLCSLCFLSSMLFVLSMLSMLSLLSLPFASHPPFATLLPFASLPFALCLPPLCLSPPSTSSSSPTVHPLPLPTTPHSPHPTSELPRRVISHQSLVFLNPTTPLNLSKFHFSPPHGRTRLEYYPYGGFPHPHHSIPGCKIPPHTLRNNPCHCRLNPAPPLPPQHQAPSQIHALLPPPPPPLHHHRRL